MRHKKKRMNYLRCILPKPEDIIFRDSILLKRLMSQIRFENSFSNLWSTSRYPMITSFMFKRRFFVGCKCFDLNFVNSRLQLHV